MSYRPLFIGGCDRSGTTMLGDMLGATPQSFATPESQWIHQLAPLLHLKAFSSPREAVDWLRTEFRFAVWDLNDYGDELESAIQLDDPARSVQAILQCYLQHNLPEKRNAPVWVDHTPDNMYFYPVLRSLFPDARYIHIVRDGRAVFQSIRDLDWGPNNAYMGTRFWSKRLEQAISVEMAEADNCLRVRYEDLLRDPTTEVQRICTFADLPFEPAMLNGGGLILPAFTRGQHKLVGKPPDPSRLDAWRTRLSQREVEDFEAWPATRRYMQVFGYTPDTDSAVTRGGLHTFWNYLHDFALYLRNRARHKRMEQSKVQESVD